MVRRYGHWLLPSLYSFGLILMLTTLSPLLMHFIMVPLVVLFSMFRMRQTWIPFLVIFSFYSLISIDIVLFMLLVTGFCLIPAWTMGHLNRAEKPAGLVIFSGFSILLGQILLILIIAFVFFQTKLLDVMSEQIYTIVSTGKSFYSTWLPEPQWEQQLLAVIEMFKTLFPALIIMFSIYFSWLSYMVARWWLQKAGQSLPGYLPIREWRLPKILVLYNIIAICLGLFVSDADSIWYTVHMNMFIVLLLLFWVQGISFMFYWTHYKQWHRSLPILGIGLSILTPILYGLSILGMIDVIFPLRKKISGQA